MARTIGSRFQCFNQIRRFFLIMRRRMLGSKPCESPFYFSPFIRLKVENTHLANFIMVEFRLYSEKVQNFWISEIFCDLPLTGLTPIWNILGMSWSVICWQKIHSHIFISDDVIRRRKFLTSWLSETTGVALFIPHLVWSRDVII